MAFLEVPLRYWKQSEYLYPFGRRKSFYTTWQADNGSEKRPFIAGFCPVSANKKRRNGIPYTPFSHFSGFINSLLEVLE
jgi:hypothetical protein